MARDSRPIELLSVFDGIVLICGMVIGAGIFKAPSIVAGAAGSSAAFFAAWILGGAVSLCGALVYAELAGRYPETGGEYAFLSRAFGRGVGFIFAWSRITVIQTGAIAAVAFVFGDYASEMLSLGKHGSAIYAAAGVIALTALNVAGTVESKTLQRVMQILLFAGLLFIAVAGFLAPRAAEPAAAAGGGGAFGLAMIFVLLTYGGWNEAAYLAGELVDARRNMLRVLVGGIVALTVLYLLVNLGYFAALGLAGMKDSKAVAADVVRAVAGDKGAIVVAIVVCLAALTTMNAAIFTGARTSYALGRDFPAFRFLGIWRAGGSTPANALLLQGAVTLVLVAASSVTPDGFTAMVAYTAPVFWTFFLLTGLTIFIFRREQPVAPFRVPFYPLVPVAFCVACLYMLYSSIDYVRNPDYGPKFGALVLAGVAIMIAGIPLYFLARKP